MISNKVIDCRSEEGVIIATIDAINVMCQLLMDKVMGHELNHDIREALLDLEACEGFVLLQYIIKGLETENG